MRNIGRSSLILAVAVLTLLSGCRQKAAQPEGVMDSATYVAFLTDAYLIEGYQQAVVSHNLDTLPASVDDLYSELYDRYHVTPAEYDSTVAYYVRHPHLHEAVYARVLDNLKARQH